MLDGQGTNPPHRFETIRSLWIDRLIKPVQWLSRDRNCRSPANALTENAIHRHFAYSTHASRQQIQRLMNDGKPNFLFSVFSLDVNLKTTGVLIPAELSNKMNAITRNQRLLMPLASQKFHDVRYQLLHSGLESVSAWNCFPISESSRGCISRLTFSSFAPVLVH